MILPNRFKGFGGGRAGGAGFDTATLYGALGSLGLTTNLAFCLDAADSASYGGSGQTITDLSGSGNHFYLGSTSGSESTDPTFTGSAGSKDSSTYFNMDGGDFFTLSVSNPAAINNLHKDNAKFTYLLFHRNVDTTSGYDMFGNSAGSGNGVLFYKQGGTGNILFLIWGGGSLVCGGGGFEYNAAYAANTWYMTAWTIDEAVGAGGGFYYVNGSTSTFNSTYSSPSTGAADSTQRLFERDGTTANRPPNGTRFGACALWSGTALTSTDLGNIRTTFGTPRYGV